MTNDEINRRVAALHGWKPDWSGKVWLAPDEHGNHVMNGWAIVAPTADDYFEFEGETCLIPPYRFGGGARGVWDCDNPAMWGQLFVDAAKEGMCPRLVCDMPDGTFWEAYLYIGDHLFFGQHQAVGRALSLAYIAAKEAR